MSVDSKQIEPSLAILVFTRQLAALVEAGRSLMTCLNSAVDSLPQPLAQAVAEVRDAVGEGATLSRTLRARPEYFPPYLERMVRLGEVGGFLDETLQMAGDLFEEEWEVSGWSESLAEQRQLRVASRSFPAGAWDALSDNERVMIIFLFCRSMAMLLSAGAPPELALETSAEVLPTEKRESTRAAASAWQSLWDARRAESKDEAAAARLPDDTGRLIPRIRELDFLPPLVTQMFESSDQTGSLHHLLDRAAQFYRYELMWRLGASPASSQAGSR